MPICTVDRHGGVEGTPKGLLACLEYRFGTTCFPIFFRPLHPAIKHGKADLCKAAFLQEIHVVHQPMLGGCVFAGRKSSRPPVIQPSERRSPCFVPATGGLVHSSTTQLQDAADHVQWVCPRVLQTVVRTLKAEFRFCLVVFPWVPGWLMNL